ncbi:DUF2637 domain-containing protein [Streptacidiphilus monticola]|uniref:DUF2637 domain-containing protein n=1 Tax=Streptacidiphilus monticola TaxID=2161674 RepID=A0ABW1GB49_9ACTN
MADRPAITKAHRALIGMVATGAFIIAGIGFAGSYAAVRVLATRKGFGVFAYVFPVGVDVGIAVLLALDLVLTWMRIPFPLLRQAAWLLTAGTIVFNAASSWGDALAMGMHAIIPVLFIVVVEAARHAVGRIADITADRHMESVRLIRWVLSPIPTFRLWRKMKLWELRSYDEVVRLEQNRLVYRAHLRAQYGRLWRRQAPIETVLPLKLAKYGVPLDLELVKSRPVQVLQAEPQLVGAPTQPVGAVGAAAAPAAPAAPPPLVGPAPNPAAVAVDVLKRISVSRYRRPLQDPDAVPAPETGPQSVEEPVAEAPAAEPLLQAPAFPAQSVPADGQLDTRGVAFLKGRPQEEEGAEAWFAPRSAPNAQMDTEDADRYVDAFINFTEDFGFEPDAEKLSLYLGENGTQVPPGELQRLWPLMGVRYQARMEA